MAEDRKGLPCFEEALRRKALGYEAVEIREIIEEDENGKRKVKREKTTKRVPPDLEAMKMWKTLETGDDGQRVTVVSAAPRPEDGGYAAGEREEDSLRESTRKQRITPKDPATAKRKGEAHETGGSA